jgi:hypothetical protein
MLLSIPHVRPQPPHPNSAKDAPFSHNAIEAGVNHFTGTANFRCAAAALRRTRRLDRRARHSSLQGVSTRLSNSFEDGPTA